MKSIKVLIAGAGGNNSWLVAELHRLIKNGQISPRYHFTIADHDTVERKNLLYQNFEDIDLLDHKARSLSERYVMAGLVKKLESPRDLEGYDIIISGVDNSKFRRMLFEYVAIHPDVFWMDLRAEGTQVAIYCKHEKNTTGEMLASLPDASADEHTASCQRQYELDSGIIQQGNKIAAVIASQFFLHHIRGEKVPASFSHMF